MKTKTYVYLNREQQRWEVFHRKANNETTQHKTTVTEMLRCPMCSNNPKEEKTK